MKHHKPPVSRRAFLKGTSALGLTALMSNWQRHSTAHAADEVPCYHHGEPMRGMDLPVKDRAAEGRFGLMFKRLPAFAPEATHLYDLGEAMLEPDEEPLKNNNSAIPAGYTFLGQFIDHDITLDTTPLSLQQADPYATTNFRTPRFDLDSIYGRGPTYDTWLYGPDGDRDKLRLEQYYAGVDDVPRWTGSDLSMPAPANLVECRNDENLIVLQIHIAFIKFHNALVDYVRKQPGMQPAWVFETARRLARWHYQWMVIHDFLPKIVGTTTRYLVYKDGTAGKPPTINISYYKPTNRDNLPFMPVEFAVAAYRFGHSMARPGYSIDRNRPTFFVPLFSDSDEDLRGNRVLPSNLNLAPHLNLTSNWKLLFPVASADLPRPSRLIDAKLSIPLGKLPDTVVPSSPPPGIESPHHQQLAARNLLRGKALGLPSGQAVARTMRARVRSNGELAAGQDSRVQQALAAMGEAPLWYYILREAELETEGAFLGPVGGRIVAEVLVGLLQRDRNSYLYLDPAWRPTLPRRDPNDFTMVDLLSFAGVAGS